MMEGSGPPQKRLRLGSGGDGADTECHRWNTPEGCPYGDRCRFRHLTAQGEDARQDGAGPQPPAPGGSRSTPCTKFFSTSGCPYGDSCHFSHYVPGGLSSAALGGPGQNGKGVVLTDGGVNLGGYKSRLCNRYREPGGCRFGDRCHFAHGEHELRPENDIQGGEFPGGTGQMGRGGAGSMGGGQFGGMGGGGGRENGGRGGIFPPGTGPEMSAAMSAAASFGQSTTTKISIDAHLVGAIIGKAGANVKQICKLTGAKLSIRDHESDANLRNVEMEGSLEQIDKASNMVRQFLMQRDLTSPPRPSGLGPHNYKTRMCENFAGGTCTFGDRCHFAHGAHELKDPPPEARGGGGIGAGGGMVGGAVSKPMGTVM